jgi:hypothetical protein
VHWRFYELAVAGPAPIASEALRRPPNSTEIEDDIHRRSRSSAAPRARKRAVRSSSISNPGYARTRGWPVRRRSSPMQIRRTIDASLKRLRPDHIDLHYQP